jgi:hypothetical protein
MTIMKKLNFLAIILLLFTITLKAQEPLTYENVIQVDSTINMEQLYNRGYNWIVSTFKNPQKVIQLEDKEKGQLICKGNFEYNQSKFAWGGSETTKGYIDFTVKLFFKDGRYKYQFTDFRHDPLHDGNSFGLITTEAEYPGKMALTSKSWRKWIWNDIKDQIDLNVKAMEKSLTEEMNKKTEIEDNDW